MSKTLQILILICICSTQLYSAEALVKFYLQDGSTKQYNLGDIDRLNIIDKTNNNVMRIHFQDTLVAYYPLEIIEVIKFEKDSVTRDILNVYIFSYPKSYILSSIDSFVFYIDQYQPLTIGSQVWMLKNLNIDHYRNGDSIALVKNSMTWKNTNSGSCCFFNNDSILGAIYGKLYNWYAVNDSRGLAPLGWHIPTVEEEKKLRIFLGGDSIAGGKMKEKGTLHWKSPNERATNESGFTALPAGFRSPDGDYLNIGYFGYWWSSFASSPTYALYMAISWNYAIAYTDGDLKGFGYSVRCIKD